MNLNYPLKNCTQCPLSNNACVVAPLEGVGREKTKFVLLAYSPSSSEDIHQTHFPGDEGTLLENMLNSVAMSVKDFYITKVIKCRLEYGTKASKKNLHTCVSNHLNQELESLKPDFILALGSDVGKYILGDKFSITKQRGFYMYKKYPTFITYHPRYLMRFPSMEAGSPKWEAWNDLKEFNRLVTTGDYF